MYAFDWFSLLGTLELYSVWSFTESGTRSWQIRIWDNCGRHIKRRAEGMYCIPCHGNLFTDILGFLCKKFDDSASAFYFQFWRFVFYIFAFILREYTSHILKLALISFLCLNQHSEKASWILNHDNKYKVDFTAVDQ